MPVKCTKVKSMITICILRNSVVYMMQALSNQLFFLILSLERTDFLVYIFMFTGYKT